MSKKNKYVKFKAPKNKYIKFKAPKNKYVKFKAPKNKYKSKNKIYSRIFKKKQNIFNIKSKNIKIPIINRYLFKKRLL